MHVCLLGDSVLDNGFYVLPGPSVAEQLSALLPDDQVTLCAVDGAKVGDVVAHQMAQIPDEATHIVLSAGGNDCLQAVHRYEMGDLLANFRARYASLLDQLLLSLRPLRQQQLIVFNIYRPRYDDSPLLYWLSALGLYWINRVIREEVQRRQVTLVDLESIFCKSDHYATPIEPSVVGGDLICANILHVLGAQAPTGVDWLADGAEWPRVRRRRRN